MTEGLAMPRTLASALLAICGTLPSHSIAQPAAFPARDSAQSVSTAVQNLLTRQVADWNRGDLDAFATGYKQSPDILFIGAAVQHGYANMLAGYKAHYPNRAAMGTLSFSDLAVQPLDAKFATTTGHFHLERSASAGGNADGYFLLVLENTAQGWKIVRDDTTALQPVKH